MLTAPYPPALDLFSFEVQLRADRGVAASSGPFLLEVLLRARAVAASSGPPPLEVQLCADRAVVLAPQSEQTSNTKGRETLNSFQSQKINAQQKERDTLNFSNSRLS